MDFLNNPNFKTSTVLKITGLALILVIVMVFAFRLIGSSFKSANQFFAKSGANAVLSPGAASYDYAPDASKSAKYAESAAAGPSLSVRNMPAPSRIAPPYGGGSSGDTAEQFEVIQYNALVETRQLDKTCGAIAGLKAMDYVIFENAVKYDRGCDYAFKVRRGQTAEILSVIKELKPKELSENSYTIKRLVDDFTSETDILRKKLASIDETLSKAVSAYDDITALAVKVKDVESLAKIIDSKINLIERLTQERISVNAQLEGLDRSKADQLDRLEYVYFNVNVFENKFVDGKALADSWKAAIKEFVRDVNRVAQDITVNLAVWLFLVLQYAVYLLILLVMAKYGWRLVKHVWQK